MTPSFPSVDRANRALMHSKLNCDFALWDLLSQACPNFNDLTFCQFRNIVRFAKARSFPQVVSVAFRSVVSLPREHIGNVLFLCTKEQMRRIYAHSVVAFVQTILRWWNWPDAKLESYSVRANHFASKAKPAVLSFFTTHPIPALRWATLINLLPESLSNSFPSLTIGIGPRFRHSPIIGT